VKKLIASFFFAAALWLSAALPADAAARFLICPTGCTITAADTSIWASVSAGATGASVPGSGDTVTFDASSCTSGTVTFGAGYNPVWQSWSWGASACTIDMATNDNSMTLNSSSSMNGSGSGVRSLTCGATTVFTLSAQNASWTTNTTTNLTLSCASAAIVYSAVSGNADRTMTGGATTWGSLTVNSRSGNYSRTWSNNGSTTFGTCTFGSGLIVYLVSSFTCTTLNVAGTSAHPTGVMSSIPGTGTTITTSTATIDWSVWRDVGTSGAQTATNSFDLGNTPNVTIQVPTGSGGGSGFFGGG
jgi:hypothetical protein